MKNNKNIFMLYIFVGSFLVVFAVNGLMVYYSQASWTGLEDKNYFIKGSNYDKVQGLETKIKALGWKADLNCQVVGMDKLQIQYTLHDRNGVPVQGVKTKLKIVRPVSYHYDTPLHLVETKKGVYVAITPKISKMQGQWDFELTAKRGKDAFGQVDRMQIKIGKEGKTGENISKYCGKLLPYGGRGTRAHAGRYYQ